MIVVSKCLVVMMCFAVSGYLCSLGNNNWIFFSLIGVLIYFSIMCVYDVDKK